MIMRKTGSREVRMEGGGTINPDNSRVEVVGYARKSEIRHTLVCETYDDVA